MSAQVTFLTYFSLDLFIFCLFDSSYSHWGDHKVIGDGNASYPSVITNTVYIY